MADRRLTEAQRREIAHDRAKGVPAQALAARFGVSRKTIERTVARHRDGPPVARPPGRTLGVWVSDQDLRAFDAVISRHGLSRSDAMKRMMRVVGDVFTDDDDRLEAVQALSAAINRIGNNVNQIARACNEARRQGQPLPYTAQAHAEVQEALKVVFAAADQMQQLAQGRRARLSLATQAVFQREGEDDL